MKIKIFLIGMLLIVILAISSVVSAQVMTEAQRQSFIAQLQAQIAQLTQQIANIIAQRQASDVAWCYTFNNNLGFADSGSSEVLNLHTALQKSGFSYVPDGVTTYSTGTSEAVKQFQTKYKIKATTIGYFGETTRTKLNSLYGCKCTSSWQSGPWSICANSIQTRTVVDLNNCGTTTNKPAEKQSCTVKPIDVSVNASDGPVDIFLTLGTGASVINTGIHLSTSVNLQWSGPSVSSCTASDSLTPTFFSGYVSASGSQVVNLSGNIAGDSSTNKVSDTFKISCISTLTGAKVNDSITVNVFYTASSNCTTSWNCTAWSNCASGKHSRTCTDSNGCGSLVNKPAVSESCTVVACKPSWQPGSWSDCVGGKQTRTVIDTNNCGTTTGKLSTSQTCCVAKCLDQSGDIWAISCSGTPTKCATGKTCEETYSTSNVYVDGVVQTTKTLTGTHCITP